MQYRSSLCYLLFVADFATIIVYSMAEDSEILEGGESASATPGNVTPVPSAISRLKSVATSDSTNSLVEAGKKAELSRKSVGGSKSLHYLHNFLQASEMYFHPSRHSQHSLVLCSFIKVLASQFLRRWKQEEIRGKHIPNQWRLTPRIKREFVALLGNLAMMSMFSHDSKAIAASKDCIKSLGHLEPQLIVTPMLERVMPALQGEFGETNRAMAGLQVISAIIAPLVRPDVPVAGGEHPLFGLMEVLLEYVDTISSDKTVRLISSWMYRLKTESDSHRSTVTRCGDFDGYPCANQLASFTRGSARRHRAGKKSQIISCQQKHRGE